MPLLTRLRYLPYRITRRILTLNISCFLEAKIEAIQSEPLPADYQFEWLTVARLNELRENPKNSISGAWNSLLEIHQAECVVVRADEVVVGLAGVKTGMVSGELNHDGDLRTKLPIELPADMAYVFGVHVVPRYRGKRLYAAMVSLIAERVSECGGKRLLLTTECSNFRALKSVRRMGFTQVGRTVLVRAGRICWANYPNENQIGDIRVGRYAGDISA
ncbi:GNAT family N-acetyltransferase [Novipirellula caenicola]|uniref:GNAT family N-acetyltransferase n=1 Tax=Novipirellula caenicola TaxID=1536901 RepID=UPI0031E82B9F